MDRQMKLLPNDTVAVYYPKGDDAAHAINRIQGARWVKGKGAHYEFGLNLEACEKLPQVAAEFNFDFDPAIYGAIERSKKAGLAAVKDSRAITGELPEWIRNRMAHLPYGFQNVGITFGMHHKRVFINDDQGLGKTVEALGVLEGAEAYKALVIVPNSVKLGWAAEILSWLPHRTISVYMGGTRTKPVNVYVDGRKIKVKVNSPYADIVIINYDQIKKHIGILKCQTWKAIVCDESHYISNPKAKRTEKVLELVNQVNPEYRLALTGTPVANKPNELVTQLEFLGRIEEFGTKSRFLKRYANIAPTGYGGVRFCEVDKRRLYELNGKLRPFQVRRLKKDVLKQLPPKRRLTLPVEIDNRDEYKWAEKDLISWLKNYVATQKSFLKSIAHHSKAVQSHLVKQRQATAEERATRGLAFRKIQALRQIAVRGKVEAVKEWITDFLEDTDEKLVVYCIHREIQLDLFEAFPGAARIYGGDSLSVRKANERKFQTDPNCKLIICSIPAAAEGITLTAAKTMLIVEMPWTALKCNQTEDRIHRIGQEGACLIYYILATETIDETIGNLIDGKRVMMSAITDGKPMDDSDELGIMDCIITSLVD